MKTYFATEKDVVSNWYIVDAKNKVLGRLASQIAAVLRGKNKPIYTPHVDCGDHVVVINCQKLVLTGNKLEDKSYTYYTGHIGGRKEIKYKKLMAEKPEFVLYEAVKGMLPKNRLGRQMIKKLRVYKDDKHNHQAQKPVELKLGE